LRTDYQEHHGRAYDGFRISIEEAIKTDSKSFFFWYVDLKKKRVGYPLVMSFAILFEKFIEQTYANDLWVPLSPGPDLENDEPPFRSLQFTVSMRSWSWIEARVRATADSEKLCFRICIA
jgi:hypothetical protein